MRHRSAIRKILTIAVHPHVIQWINGVGVIGLFIFAFGIFFKNRTANDGILIMGIAFVLIFRPIGKRLIRDPLLVSGSILFLFVSIMAVRAIIEFDGYQVMIINRMFLYGCVFLLMFLVAFWMHQARGKWNWIFFAFLTGFLAQLIRKGEWANFTEAALLYWNGVKRAGFGSSVNRFGLWSAIILLACVLLSKTIVGLLRKQILVRGSDHFLVFHVLGKRDGARVLAIPSRLAGLRHSNHSNRFIPAIQNKTASV